MTDENISSTEFEAKLNSLIQEINGAYRIPDMKALKEFITEYGESCPALYELIPALEQEVINNYQKTGAVPLGVELVEITSESDSNITNVKFTHGPSKPDNIDASQSQINCRPTLNSGVLK